MRISAVLSILLSLLLSCGSGENSAESQKEPPGSKDDSGRAVAVDGQQDDPLKNKGIGPVKEVNLGEEIDQNMANMGETQYSISCVSCHQLNERSIGPPMANVLKRRSPEWVMNMILNPGEMIDKDPIAQKVYQEYNQVPMVPMGISRDQARAIVEYLRTTQE